jgi:hypothetical protein
MMREAAMDEEMSSVFVHSLAEITYIIWIQGYMQLGNDDGKPTTCRLHGLGRVSSFFCIGVLASH